MKLMAITGKALPKDSEQGHSQAIITVERHQEFNDNKFLVRLLYTGLTIGLFWQIYGLYSMHTSPPVTLAVKLSSDSPFRQLPAISLCTNIGDSAKGKFAKEFLENMSAENMIDSVTYFSDSGKPSETLSDMKTETIESISYKYYCITLNTKEYGLMLRKDQQLNINMRKFGVYNSWWVYLHDPSRLPSGFEWNAFEVKRGESLVVGYTRETYKQVSTRLNPCSKYTCESGYASFDECVRSCVVRKTNESCHQIYTGIAVRSTDPFDVRFAETKDEGYCSSQVMTWNDQVCRKECPRPCVTDTYKPYVVSRGGYYERRYAEIKVIPSAEPEVKYQEKKAYDREMYFYYMTGTLSVWIVLSLYLLYRKLTKGPSN